MRQGRARRGPPRDSVPPAGPMEAPVQPGDRVAHYQVLGEIGRGGMGVIFRARDTRLVRDVALKCPWPHLASDATVRERFLREARSASQLSHPHIVPIFEILNWGGLPWLAMELVEGSNLRARVRDQGTLSLDDVRAKLSALAERFDATSGHTADPAVRAGIAGSTADLGAEIVADDDADNTTTAGEAGGTATPVNAGHSRRRRFDRGASR